MGNWSGERLLLQRMVSRHILDSPEVSIQVHFSCVIVVLLEGQPPWLTEEDQIFVSLVVYETVAMTRTPQLFALKTESVGHCD